MALLHRSPVSGTTLLMSLTSPTLQDKSWPVSEQRPEEYDDPRLAVQILGDRDADYSTVSL